MRSSKPPSQPKPKPERSSLEDFHRLLRSAADRRPLRGRPGLTLAAAAAGLRVEGLLIGWGFALNLAWEFGQTPLYADSGRGLRYLLWTRIHCTVGDVLILLAAFWLTALLFRTRRWPMTKGWPAAAIFFAAGLAYTIWSEWLNTTLRAAWEYLPQMPQIGGIGLAPLAQWLVLPPVLVMILRRRARAPGLRKPPAQSQP